MRLSIVLIFLLLASFIATLILAIRYFSLSSEDFFLTPFIQENTPFLIGMPKGALELHSYLSEYSLEMGNEKEFYKMTHKYGSYNALGILGASFAASKIVVNLYPLEVLEEKISKKKMYKLTALGKELVAPELEKDRGRYAYVYPDGKVISDGDMDIIEKEKSINLNVYVSREWFSTPTAFPLQQLTTEEELRSYIVSWTVATLLFENSSKLNARQANIADISRELKQNLFPLISSWKTAGIGKYPVLVR